mgnify:CR=1 FL=1
MGQVKKVDIDEEIRIKARIFDYIVEIESHQVVINGLIGKKDSLLIALNRLRSNE